MSYYQYDRQLFRLSKRCGKLSEEYYSQLYAFDIFKNTQKDEVLDKKITEMIAEIRICKRKLIKMSKIFTEFRDKVHSSNLLTEHILDLHEISNNCGLRCNDYIKKNDDLILQMNADRPQVLRTRKLLDNIISVPYIEYYVPKEYEMKCLCKCTNIQYELDSEVLDVCSICFAENVSGTRPECCKKSKNVCLECLEKSASVQYKKIYNKELKPIDYDRLFKIHYDCNFCRQSCCHKKYKFLYK
jgi:hypothetical protein